MSTLEKSLAVLIGGLILTTAFAQTYKAGERAQYRRDRAEIMARKEQAAADLEHFKRLQDQYVQAVRGNYKKGSDACQSQF